MIAHAGSPSESRHRTIRGGHHVGIGDQRITLETGTTSCHSSTNGAIHDRLGQDPSSLSDLE